MKTHHALPLALALVSIVLTALAGDARAAGVLCGSVRDAATLAPIPRAGIFLRTPAGAYTGLNTATDTGGNFCLGSITPGTYDVEVRVDDYRLAYRRNVVVVDDVSGVDIPVIPLPVRLAPPTPNPVQSEARMAFTLTDEGPVRLAVFDAQGRAVMTWREERLAAGSHVIRWNLRDDVGRDVPAGRYFVQLEALGVRVARTITRIRG